MVLQEKRIFSDSSMISQIFIHICGVILLLYAFGKDPLKCFKNLNMSFIINLAIADFLVCIISPRGFLGAVHMSRASPANRADSILSRPIVA